MDIDDNSMSFHGVIKATVVGMARVGTVDGGGGGGRRI